MTEQNPPTGATIPPQESAPQPQQVAPPAAQSPQPNSPQMPPAMMQALAGQQQRPQQQNQPGDVLELFQYRATLGEDHLNAFHSEALNKTFYWRDESPAMRDKYLGDLISDDKKMRGFVKCLFFRALNEDGSRMFEGKQAFDVLMTSHKCDEIVEVVNEMLDSSVKNEIDSLGND